MERRRKFAALAAWLSLAGYRKIPIGLASEKK
jgi:hypothetical protein